MRISECGSEVSSTQKVGKFFRVDFVVFNFAPEATKGVRSVSGAFLAVRHCAPWLPPRVSTRRVELRRTTLRVVSKQAVKIIARVVLTVVPKVNAIRLTP